MSTRKFKAPRHGSLQFRPKVRAKSVKQSIKSFPKDTTTEECHLTGFMAYKAGMTHVVRSKEVRHKNKVYSKEVLDAVTILETPKMIAHGIVGYKRTLKGNVHSKTIITEHLSESLIRRIFEKKYVRGIQYEDLRKKQGFTEEDVIELIDSSDSIRLLCYSQADKVSSLRQRKANVLEIQVNGGKCVEEKVKFALTFLEKEISVKDVFSKNEFIDTIAMTKGKGFQGTVKRWGTTILPRKSNKGIRKVACIGAWHPSRVLFSVSRAGQKGSHKRTEQNKKIYGIGNGKEPVSTVFDLTEKLINPMGGFPHYGNVNNDYIIIKGCVTGPYKRAITLRKPIHKKAPEDVSIKFIDTSSKIGSGRFQTSEEKRAFYGISKPEVNDSN